MSISEIVPIRLDIAVDDQQFQDTFCWNSSESQEAVQSFATTLCQENNLPHAVIPAIINGISQQVEACRSCGGAAGLEMAPEERNEVIKLDIKLGYWRLHDQFVWDINDLAADPDIFATALCSEQVLDRAFAPLIAWHIRDQVYTYRKSATSKLSLPPLNPGHAEKQQPPSRRTRRKVAKQPADTGFWSTYSSGVVRRPEEWVYWSSDYSKADTQPSIASHPASTVHSQGNTSDVPSQKATTAAPSQLTSYSSPTIAGQSNAGQSNAVSGQSRQNTAFQQAPSWTSQYLQQQPQLQHQQSLWMPQQQRQQATHYFIQQAQAIWEKMGLASMGVAMPQSFEQAENVVKAVQQVQQAQEKQAGNATNARSQPLYGSQVGAARFQDPALRTVSAGYGQAYTYAAPQGSQAQMNPLVSDYAGLQYPGY